jgi:hypothetical protein
MAAGVVATAKAKASDVLRLAGKGMMRETIADNVAISWSTAS